MAPPPAVHERATQHLISGPALFFAMAVKDALQERRFGVRRITPQILKCLVVICAILALALLVFTSVTDSRSEGAFHWPHEDQVIAQFAGTHATSGKNCIHDSHSPIGRCAGDLISLVLHDGEAIPAILAGLATLFVAAPRRAKKDDASQKRGSQDPRSTAARRAVENWDEVRRRILLQVKERRAAELAASEASAPSSSFVKVSRSPSQSRRGDTPGRRLGGAAAGSPARVRHSTGPKQLLGPRCVNNASRRVPQLEPLCL